MPDVVGKTCTAATAAIESLKIIAHIDMQDAVAASGCTKTPTSTLPVARTDPMAGTPLPRDGVEVTLLVDRSVGLPCDPATPPTAAPAAPPGNTYIDPPNVNVPNINVPNLPRPHKPKIFGRYNPFC